ncbi:uncharacterized protein IUM83_13443 [Phytophthora cinnamomi]|uniref:uncharacterized protein n=1 Tax=Phytophthora cinnamomi TaxID=4785 RepID=UPI0035597552|nr:hypothetical protein IUM83_13443 [Phytophthora cinnamomi]
MAPTRAGILTTSGKPVSCLYARVPVGQSIAFFLEEDCAGKLVFNSDVGKTFGNEIVKDDRAVVRSFILAKYTLYPVKGIISMCRDESASLLNATEGNDDNAEWLSISSASRGGNLSANWFDTLPDGGDVEIGDA